MIRNLGTFLLFLALLGISSCAGKPEEISEDTVIDLDQAPDSEPQPEADTTDLLPEEIQEDTVLTVAPESPAETPVETDNMEKSEPDSILKKTVEKPPEAKIVAVKPLPESPIPQEKPIPPPPVSELTEVPVVPVIEEKPAPAAPSEPPADMPLHEETPVPINPLLVTDKPVESTPEIPEYTAPEAPSVQLDDPAVSAASPSRILDEPGEFTITLDGLGWIFRSDLSSPGSWRFLERDLDGNSTHFRFMFTETGNWNLVFERQDLSSGGSENAVRNVVVKDGDGEAIIDNGPLPELSDNPISGNMPADAESRNKAADAAVSEGNIGEAMEFWEQNASGSGDAARRARASLVENAARTGALGPLLTWLPTYIEDNPDPDTLAAALDALEGQAGYESESLSILEKLAVIDNGSRRPEWLYRLASYLEKPGPERDLDRAASLYQEVISAWPLTEWRDKSEERLLWLQRHYFRVR